MGDPYRTVVIGGRTIGELPVSDVTEEDSRKLNLDLAVLSLPRLLGSYKPSEPETPLQRFDTITNTIVEILEEDESFFKDLCAGVLEVHGPKVAYEAIVYRASGLTKCLICNRLYYDHQPCSELTWAQSLCNGDLVKL